MGDCGIFYIDTKGICLMCLKDCNLYGYTGGGGGGTRIKQEIGTCTRSVSFKLLLRYLKINLFRLCSFPPTFLESMDVVEEADIVISLCGDCFLLTKSFSKLYESMEEIRLQLDACVETVHAVMTNGENQQDRLDEYHRRRRSKNMLDMMTANVAEQLRKETISKCSLKVKERIPKVNLFKRDEANMRAMLNNAVPSGRKPGPKRKTGNQNFHLTQLLMKPQSRSDPYLDSTQLFNALSKQSQMSRAGQPKPRAIKKTAKTRKPHGRIGNIEVQEGVVTDNDDYVQFVGAEDSISDEFVVKLEPVPIYTSVPMEHQEFHDEGDPLGEEMEGGDNAIYSNDNHNDPNEVLLPPAGSFSCPVCTKIFDKAANLGRHKAIAHGSVGKYTAMKQSSLLKSKKRRLRCKFCTKFFISKTKLMVHLKSHHPGQSSNLLKTQGSSPLQKKKQKMRREKTTCETANYNCAYCVKWFKTKAVYNTHVVAMHSLEVYRKKLPDGTTQKQVDSALHVAYSSHFRYPNDPSKKHYGCPFCVHRYPHPSHLKLHIIRGHFDKIVRNVKELQGSDKEGIAPGAEELGEGNGFQIEFEDGNMGNDESYHFPFLVENGDTESTERSNLNEDMMTIEHEQGQQLSGNEDYDDDPPPPILMREAYSLSEGVNVEETENRVISTACTASDQ